MVAIADANTMLKLMMSLLCDYGTNIVQYYNEIFYITKQDLNLCSCYVNMISIKLSMELYLYTIMLNLTATNLK